MGDFWLAFVPLFVPVDAIGISPAFLAPTEGREPGRRRAVILQSVITAAAVIVAFLACGPALLSFLGITLPGVMIAGGPLRPAISLNDLRIPQVGLPDPGGHHCGG